MRRLQIYINERLDRALRDESARTGRSKSAIVRECLEARLCNRKTTGLEPLTALMGTMDAEPADIDEIVYKS